MRKATFVVVLSIIALYTKAQILKIGTSTSAIATQIPGYSQVSTITTKTYNYTPSVPSTYPTPIDEDSTTEDDRIYDYGDYVPVSLSIADGNITTTSIGKVWSLRISIPNALNIGLLFNQFNLSPTAEMYIYNEARTVLDSAIKKEHFTNSNIVSISSIKGNSIIIYIVEQNNFSTFQSTVSIQKLIAGFQEIAEVGDIGSPLARPSVNCDPMIQCQPGKVTYARAVARMVTPISSTKAGFCTGTLINNEANNGRAYFLTAFHCIDLNKNNVIDQSEIDALASSVFQFQFWRTNCNGTTNNRGIEFLGATLRAASKSSDIALLELLNPPGIGDLVNYAGWNRQTTIPTDNTGFIIHHPQTLDMRITSASTIKSWFWNSNYWSAHYYSGTVDKGSSGSALLNAYGQIVGQLSSGWSNCNYTNFGDRYGKFDKSWNLAGLQTWLSPAQGAQATGLLNLTDITIDGPGTVGCTILGVFSTLPNLLGVTYQWAVTAGTQINSGQGTSSVNISSINSSISSGTLTLTLRSPAKGRTRIYTVAKQITFGTPPISLTSSTNGCSGVYQLWNIVNNTPTYGSNWNWSVGSLGTNSQIIINNPTSPGTTLSVKGGGSVRLNYTDLCGVARTDGVTVYSSCGGFGLVVSPNPAQDNINVSLLPVDNSQTIAGVTTESLKQLRVVESNGKTIMSLFEVNTNMLVKQWKHNESNTQNYNLKINGLRKGIYILQVDRDNQTNVTKIIIE